MRHKPHPRNELWNVNRCRTQRGLESSAPPLRRAEQALQETLGHSHAANLAFIALSLHQLGQIDEARIALDRLRGFLRNPPRAPRIYAAPGWSKAVASPTFLREAEALIGSFRRAPR